MAYVARPAEKDRLATAAGGEQREKGGLCRFLVRPRQALNVFGDDKPRAKPWDDFGSHELGYAHRTLLALTLSPSHRQLNLGEVCCRSQVCHDSI